MIGFILWYLTFVIVMGLYIFTLHDEIKPELPVAIIGATFIGLIWPIFLGKLLGDISNGNHKTK